MVPVTINSPPKPESSEEELSDSQVSNSSEDDDSMEDEPSDSENNNGETEANGIKDEFWARYPSLKMFLSKEMVKEFISEEYILEKGKLIGDNKAKELNEKCEVLFIKEIEHLINKYRFMADVLELLFL
ncbi:unnamed protein product [Arabidopsis thaliana]|uniref:Uncharacterized protein n=2 Tax=Arabidopsis thaliana TaxID=3702 RepID=B3H5G6_ARATH|nr:uncharacterized protein AT1G71470 [Arabidopsis thaliana]AEE35205.1 hypothetical protein AT1G71470 [Arabidopsis thaliana]CAA0329612.1 unnamed protein product [Arabidopsis thaliana]CAD5316923.1 unnamed protein product [Arabidopsis thaliana]VYS50716.1 unnamed protein product [Arabidopsis thaliana]|eukprot:NP_001117583.1 hypothetical protein AT1G71470 [Arabidopsis thaliana]